MGYKFQFVTLAGFHALNHSMFQLAKGYAARGMAAYSELQQAEFAAEPDGYTAIRHQREVGTGYFDAVATAISAGHPPPPPWQARPKRHSSGNRAAATHPAMTTASCMAMPGRPPRPSAEEESSRFFEKKRRKKLF